MMIGAKSRDAPRRARPKAALNLVRIANGMDNTSNDWADSLWIRPDYFKDIVSSLFKNSVVVLKKIRL